MISVIGVRRFRLRELDWLFKFLIWYSVILTIVEMSVGHSPHSRAGHPFFLWSERVVAMLMTTEVFIRFRRNPFTYFRSPLNLIDVLAVAPFWIGFFVPPSYLGIVRALRMLRLLKYFRYSRPLQFIALGFYRAWPAMRPMIFGLGMWVLFGTVMMFQVEHAAQPEKFSNLANAGWYVVMTSATVDTGMAPETPAGKILLMCMMFPALAVFAGMVGIIGNELSEVMELADDVGVDPFVLFRQERGVHKKIKKLDEEYRSSNYHHLEVNRESEPQHSP